MPANKSMKTRGCGLAAGARGGCARAGSAELELDDELGDELESRARLRVFCCAACSKHDFLGLESCSARVKESG